MNDIEEAISYIENTKKHLLRLGETWYADYLDDVIDLLKEQEPKLVHVTADINRRKIGECPNCGKMINSGDYPNYCGRCGQAVKWG